MLLCYVYEIYEEKHLFFLQCSFDASCSWAINSNVEVMLLKENNLNRHFLRFNERGS